MKLVNEFTVAAPIEQTWTTLLDVERVCPATKLSYTRCVVWTLTPCPTQPLP